MTEALDVSAVAEAVASAVVAPPPPLPSGWILKECRSQPGYYYYYNSDSGICTWQPPVENFVLNSNDIMTGNDITPQAPSQPATIRPPEASLISEGDELETEERHSKRRKTSSPSQVRVLHILKKHKDSRRPSSWRQPVIAQSLEEAREELQGLLEILQEEQDPEELQATFEELARTESDCSSAKRGGDLGFFGRRKMQPAFEASAFGLEIGQLSKELTETSSGVHILLRIG
jgi:NIMA-interacting peptidyl-prolyl cis-trans isomerase 1